MSDDSWLELATIPTPAVALGASRRIAGESFEQLMVARCTFVADGNAANRFLALDVSSGDDAVIARVQSATPVTAGLTARFTWAVGLGVTGASASGEQILPLPDVMFPPGFKFTIGATNIQATDQLSVISMYVRRWPSGEWKPSRGARPV
jgi:hypothetical protein